MIWLIVTRWIGLLRLYNFLDPEKGICDKLCSKTGKESPHCSGCHGECDSVSILSVIVNNSYLKNSAMNIELWCLRKLFNNEFFWSWLTNTNNKKIKIQYFLSEVPMGTRSESKKIWDINHVIEGPRRLSQGRFMEPLSWLLLLPFFVFRSNNLTVIKIHEEPFLIFQLLFLIDVFHSTQTEIEIIWKWDF